jgi:BlaI family transcriptional regulator, penicillinase repressor
MPHDLFTPREMDIMSILWDSGSGTVAEVREALADPLAYTSVLSALRTLEEKGFIDHVSEGRAHRYRPLVDWRTAGTGELTRLVKQVFKGSPELLLVQLMDEGELEPSEIRRLRDLLDERLANEDE